MIWVWALFVLAAFCSGYLTGRGTGVCRCRICFQPLPPVHQDGRCGGTPGVVEDIDPETAGALESIENRLRRDRDTDEEVRKAYSRGYVEGVRARLSAEDGESL